MSNREKATISDLPVHSGEKLTSSVKDKLCQILEDEFSNQTAEIQVKRNQAQQEELVKYRKEVGFDKIVAKIRKLQIEIHELGGKISELGLMQDGSMAYGTEASKALADRITLATKKYSGPRSEKNKLIARLQLAKTYGEAMVILQEVLGNSIIPTLTKNEVNPLQIEHEK